MKLDAAFYEKLSRFRLAMGHKSSMNLSGNRKSMQKGSSTEFSDFREYMPGDDIRRIDWNAYGRLDRLYIKEYMEEKESIITILIDTSASMEYGKNKKSELACMLAAAMVYIGLNNMDRVVIYDMQRMQSPFIGGGGKKVFLRFANWLEQCHFEGRVDIGEAIRQLPAKGPGVTIIISDFLQEAFLAKEEEAARRVLRFLNYRKQKAVFLHVLAGEELMVELTGTRNLIDMEDNSTLRLTLDANSIRAYEEALKQFTAHLQRECARAGAFYAICNTNRDFQQLIFQDLRVLYDI
ncbi:MAG: DUF58 domain-containing protein [Lachnospiraceae bacterium]|nr:DUF58 domain-containing protein [Lachnospiraceae bacterium]